MVNVTINGVGVDYKQGIIIHEKLTEDLDTGFLIVPHKTEMSIEPMDTVAIYDSSVPYFKYMKVSDITKKISKWNGTREYNYELGLISPTIQLQRIVLPNRSVTQPVTGTKTTAFTILNQYRLMYAPSFTFSSALITLLSSYDCPEFQWNRPTFFEVCNDVLSEGDAVVTFSSGSVTEISYLDLLTDGDAITGSFTDIVETQNITDYADKIECEIENAVVGKRNTRTVEWITVKTDVDAVITTENFKLILEKPIYKINKVTQRWSDGVGSYSADVTDYIVEKKLYDKLYPSNSTGVVTGAYKRNRYYFEDGGTTIEGMAYHEDTWLGITSLRAIINVFANATGQTLTNTECLEFVFQVDYQAQETVKLISNKETAIGHNSTLINNQDTSYVDFGAFARKQQLTVNRLGNLILILTGKRTLSTMPSLRDYYDTDYKLAEREYSIFDDHVNFKGICSKNYILQDIFTGIKSARRYTSIASGSEAFDCNHIEEINLNLSSTNATSSAALENYLMHFGQADNGIEVIKFATNESDDLLIAPSAYWTNKSLILTWKMYDNFNAGLSSDSTVAFGGTTLGINNVPYVNENGNFETYDYSLYKSMTNDDLDSGTWSAGLVTARKLPLYLATQVTLNDLIYSDTNIYRYNDNRETLVETKQFNITSDDDVFAGNLFFSNSSLTYTGTTDVTRYVAYSLTETYVKGDQVKKGTIAPLANLTTSRTNNYYKVYSPDSSIDFTTFASWCICDSSGNIYLAKNGNDEYIYLNKEA